MGMFRAGLLGFVILSVIYLIALVYSRSVRREELEKDWDARHPGRRDDPERRRFIDDGMAAYGSSLRVKLLWLVYILPMAAILGTAWYINSQ